MGITFLINATRVVNGERINRGFFSNDYSSEHFLQDEKVTITAPGGKVVAMKNAGEVQLTVTQ